MKQMKKLLALLLALALTFALAACGGGTQGQTETPAGGESTPPASEETTPAGEEPSGEAITDPDQIPDTMESADGKYQVAFVTDVGQLKDKSFNQGTFDGVKLYAANNGLSYKYYQPANANEATDEDRYNAMMAAVNGGAEVVVCAGYLQEAALRRAANDAPDVPFVFIDGYPIQRHQVRLHRRLRPERRRRQRAGQRGRHRLHGGAGRLPGRLRRREGRL